MISAIGKVVLGLLVVFILFYEVQAQSPCSAWSNNPQNCSSDNIHR